MNVVVTQTEINASVSDTNISVSAQQSPISISAPQSNPIPVSVGQTQVNASTQQASGILVALYQTPVNVTVSSGGGGGGSDHDPVTLGTANGLSLSGQVLSLALSTSLTVGALSAADWIVFNNKLSDAPSDGQVYGRKNAAWVPATGTSGGGSLLPVADTQTIIKGSSDPTKLLRFEVDGFTAGATRVLTPPNQDITLAGQNYLNVFTVNQQVNAHLAVGANSNVSNPGQSLPVYAGSVFSVPVSAEEEFSSSPTGVTYVRSTLGFLHVNPSANAPQTYFAAADFQAHTKSSNDKDIVVMEGVYGYAWHQGSGDITSLAGLEFYAYNAGAGDVDSIYGITANAYHDGSGVVANLYGGYMGIYIAGSVTNAYGLYIDPVSGATNNWAVYSGTGDWRVMSSASDKIGFHGATPVAQQTVTGSRGGNAALASLLTKLANLGLIVDNTS